MKTKEQIKDWLESQPWYGKFMAYAEWCGRDQEYIDSVLNSKHPDWLIGSCFLWSKAPEGPDYWRNINKEFTEWLNS